MEYLRVNSVWQNRVRRFMKLDFKCLSHWQQQVFAAALLQRMLPNYEYFSQSVQFGEYSVLANQMDVIWQKLSQLPIKFNLEAQLEKLEEIIPSDRDYDVFAVFPAIDVCSGMMCLLESFGDQQTRCAYELSELSLSSVKGYASLKSQANEDDNAINSVEEDPLLLWELQTQQELYQHVLAAIESRESCKALKMEVICQRLTNLAIEY